MVRQKIVFLTGAGISAESGLATFRGKDGLWTNEKWVELATIDSLENNTQECLDFYNWRRKQLSEVEPNEAHRLIAALEKERRSGPRPAARSGYCLQRHPLCRCPDRREPLEGSPARRSLGHCDDCRSFPQCLLSGASQL